ncbi:MAG: mandelate racemase/muconate lactonizing enzyme family protein [Eubacteriales bacterium]|nr:mandelate racemase/muconate lactonizing enzyme family protein [Eubacteriales bacterium]
MDYENNQAKDNDESLLQYVNPYSKPSDLKITDIRFTNIAGAPYPLTLVKVYTNQGIVGLGEQRDISSPTYGKLLKSRLIGENPCDVDRLFRRIKQFGFHGRQGGGVSGIEVALWDIAGKAYNIPVYRMLGGAFRKKIRIYCDTDVDLTEDRSAGEQMGMALKKRMDKGFTMLKMDVGINLLTDIEDALSYPLFSQESNRAVFRKHREVRNDPSADKLDQFYWRNREYDVTNTMHPFTGVQITEIGLDYLEQYVADVRKIIGYKIPLATDHFGFMGVEELIKVARRLEKFNLAWMEDCIPWQYTDQWKRLSEATATPLCVGEDQYLAESFLPLLRAGAVSVVHPDPLTLGGIYETKKLGDMAQYFGVRMALHMAEGPVGAMAAATIGAATENFIAMEYHANDVPWWNDMVICADNPIIKNGFIDIPDRPGLGIDDYNDEVLAEHVDPRQPGVWPSTDEWDDEWCRDRFFN